MSLRGQLTVSLLLAHMAGEIGCLLAAVAQSCADCALGGSSTCAAIAHKTLAETNGLLWSTKTGWHAGLLAAASPAIVLVHAPSLYRQRRDALVSASRLVFLLLLAAHSSERTLVPSSPATVLCRLLGTSGIAMLVLNNVLRRVSLLDHLASQVTGAALASIAAVAMWPCSKPLDAPRTAAMLYYLILGAASPSCLVLACEMKARQLFQEASK